MNTNLILPIFFLAIALVGFFRSTINQQKPEGLLNLNELTQKWLDSNNWLSRFSLIVLPFILVYNVFLWAIYGVKSILEFLAFIFAKVRWLVLFIWEEVLTPSIFWLLKLIWHYPIGFLWKFFEFSFRFITPSLQMDSLKYSFLRLLRLSGVLAIVYLGYLFYSNVVTLVIGSLIFLLYFQYSIYKMVQYHRSEFSSIKIMPLMTLVFAWLIIAAASSSILYLVFDYKVYFVSAIGITLTNILLPIIVLLLIALVGSITCLAPYYVNKDKVNSIEFLKSILMRLPKLLYAQPFQLLGGLIVTLIPFLLVYTLNIGVKTITSKDFIEWHTEVSQIGTHVPSIQSIKHNIKHSYNAIDSLVEVKDSLDIIYKKNLKSCNSNLEDVKKLESEILDDKIHSFEGEVYVGETQFFSIPKISNCAQYKWQVEKDEKIITQVSSFAYGNNVSSKVFKYRWIEPGKFKVKLIPSNSCGDGVVFERDVFVIDQPSKKSILKPQGKTVVCENEELTYKTSKGYKYYEWRHPFGETTSTKESLTLNWGDVSGTIQVRAQDKDGNYTLWRGTDVTVNLSPGKTSAIKRMLGDEQLTLLKSEHPFTFITREHAEDSINKIVKLKESLIKSYDLNIENINSEIEGYNAAIVSLKDEKSNQIHLIIGKLIATVGLILIVSILFIALFSYFVLYHFDLFAFEQQGEHYWRNTLNQLMKQNPRQPLFGFFILICIVLIVRFILINL